MLQRLQGKVALVTGSTSGIGRATAMLFAQEGARVIVSGRREDLGGQVVAEIRAAGGEGSFFAADLSQGEQVGALVDSVLAACGRLDILVNNAFSFPASDGTVVDVEERAWDQIMDLALRSVFIACKRAIPPMIQGGGGCIINTSSVHGVLAARRSAAYETAKAGLIHLTRQIAVDFGAQGIRCNAVCPGWIILERSEEYSQAHRGHLRRAQAMYPLGRPGYPIDVARSALFLASDESSFITGQALIVDGGLTIQLQDPLAFHLEQPLRERGWRW